MKAVAERLRVAFRQMRTAVAVMATKRSISREVYFAPYRPYWLLVAFPALRLERGWDLVGYTVFMGRSARTLHFACRGLPPGPEWLAKQVEDLSWAPFAGGLPRSIPSCLDPRVAARVRCQSGPEGWWQLACFVRWLEAAGQAGTGGEVGFVDVVTSPADVAGRRWKLLGPEPSCWLPRARPEEKGVIVEWHEKVERGSELLVVGVRYLLRPDGEVEKLAEVPLLAK